MRVRLLIGLSVTVAVFWCVVFAGRIVYLGYESEPWDSSLRQLGNLILGATATHGDWTAPTRAGGEQSTAGVGTAEVSEDDEISFQIWVDHRLLVRSKRAPNTPLKPDFKSGAANQTIGGDVWRVFDTSDAQSRLHVQVGKSPTQVSDALFRVALIWAVVTAILLTLPSVAIWLVVRWTFKPVDAMRSLMLQRAAFDLTPLPEDALPTEVQILVASFNHILQQVDQGVQTERRFIADAAHELRTPLAVLTTRAQVALRATTLQDKNDAIERLIAGIERSTRLSEQLLDLARLDAEEHAPQLSAVNLSELIEIIARDFENSARHRQQSIVLDTEPTLIAGNIDDLGILLRNLLDNALRYSGDRSRVTVSCHYAEWRQAVHVKLMVADNGPGVPQAERERIFDRFYRVSGSGQRGSGIGLSLVARIASSHQAQIVVGPEMNQRGLCVAIYFRAEDASLRSSGSSRSGLDPPGGNVLGSY